MKHSLQLRITIALGTLFLVLFFASIINLFQFHSFEKQTTKIMSGDQKNLIDIQLLEAKARALETLAENSVSSVEENDSFKEKVNSIMQEVNSFDIKLSNVEITDESKKSPDDLFISYRNVKTTAFQMYRNAWANKWMNVARMTGLIINDLDNVSHQVGEKAFSPVNTKLTQMTSTVTTSALSQETKLQIFNMISGLKDKIVKYSESYDKSVKIKNARISFVNKLVSEINEINVQQTKNLSKFRNGNSNAVVIAFMVFMFAIMFSIIWTWLNLRGFSKHLSEVTSSVNKQLSNWFTPSGISTMNEIQKPRYLDYEFHETFEILDQVIKKVNSLRKEDVSIKKMLNTPFVLISKTTKKAVYWNSAISNLGKLKTIEELGSTPYINIIKFTDIQNKSSDPIEKCILDSKETVSLLLFKSGQENIATQVTVSPVSGSGENEIEYIFVQIRDLREENKRLEAELDRQLESVRVACSDLETNNIPALPNKNSRMIIQNTIESLRTFAIVHTNKQENVTQKIETVWEKITRENNLKQNIQKKFESIAQEMISFKETFNNIQILSSYLKDTSKLIDDQTKEVIGDHSTINKKGNRFSEDVKKSKTLLIASLAELARAEELTKSVRVHEKTIHMLMQKASLLSINNSILENKKQFNPDDIIMITENLNQILIQFQRTYRLIETSVSEIEKGYHNMGTKIRDQLAHAMALLASEQSVIEGVNIQTAKISELNQNIDKVFNHVDTFDDLAVTIEAQSKNIADKAEKMIELTRASLQLHNQIEESLKEVTGIQANSLKFNSQPQNITSVLNSTSVSG